VALPISHVPPKEDLLRLAEAALANASDLLADARLLAEAGRFPRAHALATLACEEIGKEYQCLREIWLPGAPNHFWDSFARHKQKLSHVQGLSLLRSGQSIESAEAFNDRVRQESKSAHERKLRGLYVDYADGALKLPSEITEAETRQLIDMTQSMLDNSKATWTEQVSKAHLLSQASVLHRSIWIVFIWWAAYNEANILVDIACDGWTTARFESISRSLLQEVESAGGFLPFLDKLSERQQATCI
jgi:AbiV family abortive infection protein